MFGQSETLRQIAKAPRRRRCSVQEDSYVVVAGEVLKGSEVRSVPTVFPRVRRHVPVDCQESTWNA